MRIFSLRVRWEKLVGRVIIILIGLSTAYGFFFPVPGFIKEYGLAAFTNVSMWAIAFLGGVVFFFVPLLGLGIPYLTVRMLLDKRREQIEGEDEEADSVQNP